MVRICLQRINPRFNLGFAFANFLLEFTEPLIFLTFVISKIVIRKVAVGLFHFTFHLVPVSAGSIFCFVHSFIC